MRNVNSHIPPSVAIVMLLGLPISIAIFVLLCFLVATHPHDAQNSPPNNSNAPVGVHPPIPENEKSDAWDRELRAAHSHNDYFIARTATAEYGVYYWDFRRSPDNAVVRYKVDERRGIFTLDFRN